MADQALVFDSAGRHVPTTTTGGTYEKFVRDATGWVVQRDAHATNTTTVRYGFTGSGDSADLQVRAPDVHNGTLNLYTAHGLVGVVRGQRVNETPHRWLFG